MGYVTLALFKKYANKADQDETGEALYQIYLDSAEAVVQAYLGFAPKSQAYTHILQGTGKKHLYLNAKPVTAIANIEVDGVAWDEADYRFEDEKIISIIGNVFPSGSEVEITYTAGWATVPGDIQEVVLEIASLKAMQAGENIGLTSTSFDGGNSRTFVNYTNYDKYLDKLYHRKLVKI
ncbi:MAG: hypothetical protein AB7T74_02325 [Clostridia bacterium]